MHGIIWQMISHKYDSTVMGKIYATLVDEFFSGAPWEKGQSLDMVHCCQGSTKTVWLITHLQSWLAPDNNPTIKSQIKVA